MTRENNYMNLVVRTNEEIDRVMAQAEEVIRDQETPSEYPELSYEVGLGRMYRWMTQYDAPHPFEAD